MARTKSTTQNDHPFSKAYWIDAAAEMKDVRMLVFAALMIAIRVAMKPLNIHLAPGLQINTAFLANATGAMVFGPVMAAFCAVITDTLGCIIFPQGPYFLPMVLPEIAGSVIFALLLYRTKITTVRITISRFLICFLVNVLLTSPLMVWYYSIYYPKSTYILDVPRVIKNLFMFPLESLALTVLLGAIVPVTNRMGMTHTGVDAKSVLKFSKKEIAVLALLFAIGVGFVGGYLTYHYKTTSLSASYETETRVERNQAMQLMVRQNSDACDTIEILTVVESAKKEFLGKEVTYSVAVYHVKEGQPTEDQWKYSKSKAAADEGLERIGTATIVVEEKTDKVLSFNLAMTQ